jgi:hypothetical protein
LLPLAGLECLGVVLEPGKNIVDAACATKVGRKPRQAVIDDVGVRVIETRKNSGAIQIDDSRARPA